MQVIYCYRHDESSVSRPMLELGHSVGHGLQASPRVVLVPHLLFAAARQAWQASLLNRE
jgi:hypothetical protein